MHTYFYIDTISVDKFFSFLKEIHSFSIRIYVNVCVNGFIIIHVILSRSRHYCWSGPLLDWLRNLRMCLNKVLETFLRKSQQPG